MPYELVLCPFELKVPCKHVKFVTLRARSIVEAWIYLLIKGCTSESKDLGYGRDQLGESILGLGESRGFCPILLRVERTQLSVERF